MGGPDGYKEQSENVREIFGDYKERVGQSMRSAVKEGCVVVADGLRAEPARVSLDNGEMEHGG